MVTRKGLAEVVEGTMIRYKITARGEEALEHMRELVELRGKRDDETKNRSLSPIEEMKRYNNYQIKNYCI